MIQNVIELGLLVRKLPKNFLKAQIYKYMTLCGYWSEENRLIVAGHKKMTIVHNTEQ